MNDPIIHAPISKIVEAIKKVSAPFPTMNQPEGMIFMKSDLQTTLASLGGDAKCKDCNDSGQVPIGEEQGYILYSDCPCQTPNPSEREVLEGFRKFYNDAVSFAVVDFSISESVIDRYLAEKQSKT